jgi:DNA-binding NarL/FixJ family response regulator
VLVAEGAAPARGLRVLVVDDHEVLRNGLRWLLSRVPWVERCAGARSGPEALVLAGSVAFDLALVDVDLGAECGLATCERLAELVPTVALLTSRWDLVPMRTARQAGARGVIAKDRPARALLGAVHELAAGRTCEPVPVDGVRFIPREREILRLVGAGLTNAEIGASLYLAPGTIKHHMLELYDKLGAPNRAAAVHTARRLGVLGDHRIDAPVDGEPAGPRRRDETADGSAGADRGAGAGHGARTDRGAGADRNPGAWPGGRGDGDRRPRVLVVDADDVRRAGMLLALQGTAVVAGARDATDAVAAAARIAPDVAIVGDGDLRSALPGLRTLLMRDDERGSAAELREAGAVGIVRQWWTAERLADAVERVCRGPREAGGSSVAAGAGSPDPVSPREREVLAAFATGATNPAIAATLGLSPNTVKQHASSIFRKLGVRNRAEAVRRANDLGLLAT